MEALKYRGSFGIKGTHWFVVQEVREKGSVGKGESIQIKVNTSEISEH